MEGQEQCVSLELYFDTKHDCAEKCTMGSSAGQTQRCCRGVTQQQVAGWMVVQSTGLNEVQAFGLRQPPYCVDY